MVFSSRQYFDFKWQKINAVKANMWVDSLIKGRKVKENNIF